MILSVAKRAIRGGVRRANTCSEHESLNVRCVGGVTRASGGMGVR